MTLSFSDPEETGGTRLNPKDILGHLLLVWAVDYIAHSVTQYTRPDKPSDVIVVDVVDLDLADENGRPGLCARRTWWRQAQLILALKGKIGDLSPVLARMDRGAAAMGRAAPYLLTNMKGDPHSVNRAQQWAAAHPGFAPSSAGPPPAAVMDPWEKQPPLPPPRPVTPQEQTILERMARSSVQPSQDQGPIPF